ncbi:CoA-binding domain protein [mine drainage metagenome]|uniref:CoA-binding domain protein n=1 Tax=mine drainage metagenome TaxID=410659 RepID=T0YN37_9ZZZZ
MCMDEKQLKENIRKILLGFHVIAVVGCSREEGKPSHDVPKYLKSVGFRIIPVNPFADYILEEKAYKKLSDIPEKVEVVDVFRPAAEALQIANEAYAIGAKALWLQEGIISEEAEEFAVSHGMLFVMNRCMMKEHYSMNIS